MNRRGFLSWVAGMVGGVSSGLLVSTGVGASSVADDIRDIQRDIESLRRAFDGAALIDKAYGYDKPYSMLHGFVALDCPHCNNWLNSRASILSALSDSKHFFLFPLSPFYAKDGRSMPVPAVEVIYAMMLSQRYGPSSGEMVRAARLLSNALRESKGRYLGQGQVFGLLERGVVRLPDEVKGLMGTDSVLVRYWRAVDVFRGLELDAVPALVSAQPREVVSFSGDMNQFLVASDKMLRAASRIGHEMKEKKG